MKPGTTLTYLFTESGLWDLDRFVDKKTLFAFDLDGTLAPITSDPRTIQISGKIRSELARLINRQSSPLSPVVRGMMPSPIWGLFPSFL